MKTRRDDLGRDSYLFLPVYSAPRAHSKTYKVPRRPYESARLDAELKVSLALAGGGKRDGIGTEMNVVRLARW